MSDRASDPGLAAGDRETVNLNPSRHRRHNDALLPGDRWQPDSPPVAFTAKDDLDLPFVSSVTAPSMSVSSPAVAARYKATSSVVRLRYSAELGTCWGTEGGRRYWWPSTPPSNRSGRSSRWRSQPCSRSPAEVKIIRAVTTSLGNDGVPADAPQALSSESAPVAGGTKLPASRHGAIYGAK